MKRLFNCSYLFFIMLLCPIDMVSKGIQTVRQVHVFYCYVSRSLDVYRGKIPKSFHTGETQFVRNLLCCVHGSTNDPNFDIEVPDEDAEKFQTVSDIVNYVEAKA